MNGFPIVTERLVLRPPLASDLSEIARFLSDYEVVKNLSRVPYPYDLEAGRAWLAAADRGWHDPDQMEDLSAMITLDGNLAGCISLKSLQLNPEIGYWLGRDYWGRGLMSEAAGAMVSWFFANTGHDVLAGEAMADNAASLKVLTKAGFKVTGNAVCNSLSRGCGVPAIRTEIRRQDLMN